MALDRFGSELGYPVMIDKFTDWQQAVVAHTNTFPIPASFPEGFVVAGDVLQGIFYSGSGCTGTMYVQNISASHNYREVLYQVAWSPILLKGPILPSSSTHSVASRRQTGTGECVGTSGTMVGIPVTMTSFSLTMAKPWSLVSTP
jgi:hypothetical protein